MEKLTRAELVKKLGKKEVEHIEEMLKLSGKTLEELIDKTNAAALDPTKFILESHLNLQMGVLKQSKAILFLAVSSLIHTTLWFSWFISKLL